MKMKMEPIKETRIAVGNRIREESNNKDKIMWAEFDKKIIDEELERASKEIIKELKKDINEGK